MPLHVKCVANGNLNKLFHVDLFRPKKSLEEKWLIPLDRVHLCQGFHAEIDAKIHKIICIKKMVPGDTPAPFLVLRLTTSTVF